MNQSGGADSRRRRKPWMHRPRNYGPPLSPFLHWKLDDNKTTAAVEHSARKLAAGLWQLRFTEISRGQDLKLDFDPSAHYFRQPQLELSSPYPKCVLARSTKWDPGCSEECDDLYQFYNLMKLLKDCQVTTGSVVSNLNAEIMQARLRICELEAKRKSFKKKVKQYLRNLEVERMSWQSRARQEYHALEGLKAELGRERKSRQQMENINTNLVNQLASAKLSLEQFLKNYEDEKKSRKFMEEVCNKLAEQIGEDKGEAMALKRESMKILEEAEEERKMLQIAEAWRKERVQMKLIDAKLALEDKYGQLNKLITDVETFLRSGFGTLDMVDLRKAELILHAVKSLNIQDIEEFSYITPKSDDIFSVFEELRQCEGNGRETELCIGHSPCSQHSKGHPVSREDNGLNKTSLATQLNFLNDYNSCLQEDARVWENMSCAEAHGPYDSLEGRNPSINRAGQDINVLMSRSQSSDNAGQHSPHRDISEVCSASEKQSKQSKLKASSSSMLWRTRPKKGDQFCKIVLDEGERRVSNGITSSWGTNACRGLFEHETRHRDSVGQWMPTDVANPHITRGMKGAIEWPRGNQKNGLKTKLLEAKIESQKSQLRHVLKQKIR